MGKPYLNEMESLAETYRWALTADLADLQAGVWAEQDVPLLAVGSGGSFTAAALLAQLHHDHTGSMSRACTPLQAGSLAWGSGPLAVWLMSARGRNSDILGAFDESSKAEPTAIHVLTMQRDTPLGQRLRGDRLVPFEFNCPVAKDGYLATNSLLATAVLLMRAYSNVRGSDVDLPKTFSQLGHGLDVRACIEQYVDTAREVLSRHDIIVLHGNSTAVGAIDLESKFVEAALAAVLRADYRDFAHGRHHWLSRYNDSTAVLAFVTDEDRDLAEATIKLIPKTVPIATIPIHSRGSTAQLVSLVGAFLLTAAAGLVKGVDPGRPGVADFGSKLYNLRPSKRKQARSRARRLEPAIERKARRRFAALERAGTVEYWLRCLDQFKRTLRDARFGSVVVDLDGTVVETHERFADVRPEVAKALSDLLRSGLFLGIATGRGGSARDLMSRAIPRELHNDVLIGYYNGAVVRRLSESVPEDDLKPCEALLPVLNLLKRVGLEDLECRVHKYQITIKPRTIELGARGAELWGILQQMINAARISGVRVLRSTHSIDVIASHVSKLSVVAAVKDGRNEQDVLCIGDSGDWPGNDFELLAEAHGLSVADVSRMPTTCWNILPPGIRGTRGTEAYLRALRIIKPGTARFEVDEFL